jgi:hypothetical protein
MNQRRRPSSRSNNAFTRQYPSPLTCLRSPSRLTTSHKAPTWKEKPETTKAESKTSRITYLPSSGPLLAEQARGKKLSGIAEDATFFKAFWDASGWVSTIQPGNWYRNRS